MEFASTREGYGKGLLKAGEIYPTIVSLDADLGKSTKSDLFKKQFPERAFNFGIAEQDMMSTAAGLAQCGKVVFASTFAIFSERGFEQIRNSIARMGLNVKIVGSHAGLITGEDGSSAQAIEDIAIFRTVPGIIVISPADAVEAEKLTLRMAEYKGPVYLRVCREKTPIIFDSSHMPKIGKGVLLKEGSDVCIIATGPLVWEALKAHDTLKEKGISAAVVNIHTIKPLDSDLIIEIAKKTKGIITCEDHSIIGGLGGAVSETVSENFPLKVIRIGVKDKFGESGKPRELYEKYGLTAHHICEAAEQLVGGKNQ